MLLFIFRLLFSYISGFTVWAINPKPIKTGNHPQAFAPHTYKIYFSVGYIRFNLRRAVASQRIWAVNSLASGANPALI